MKKIYLYPILIFLAMSLSIGCFKDLDTVPIDEDILTSETFYRQPGAYKAVLAKIYAGLAVTGQQGPAGQGDLGGIDEGFSSYLRQYWYQQELTTDEALVGWNDETIKDFHSQSWTPSDVFINAFYNRVFYQIGVCNEFIRQTSNEALDRRGTDATLKQEVESYRNEARFMRALSYWHALDEFRNVPFVTEEDGVGVFNPKQIQAAELYAYIESELLDVENKIVAVRANEYGRADQGAVWMLLAKLYLNANQYISQEKYTECLTYCEKLISAGYSMEPEFEHLFLADNHNSNEIIFPITFDGINTQTWGGTTFIIRAGIGGELDPAASGVTNGWGGTRTTKQIVNLFGEIGGTIYPFTPRTDLPQVYIPGTYQGNDPTNSDFALAKGDGDDSYEGHQYFTDANTSFLFAPNPTLSFVYGDNGADGTLEIAGDPIVAGEAGYYFISVNTQQKSYTLERRDWSVTGSAIGQETNLEWDEDLGQLKLSLNVLPGELYFRANGSDDINLGDTDLDGILEYNGAPLTIQEAGPVEIILDLRKRNYIYQVSSLSYDRRGIFGTKGQSLEIDDVADFNHGYAILKFKNVNADGTPGSNSEFPDTDFPMFRLGDVYLMAAEAILRGAGGGAKADAVSYFNTVRSRAFKSTLANITEEQLSLSEILDERARELMWEAHRRTDLIRFGKFSDSDYLWAWKGGIKEGKAVESYRDVFPIPVKDLNNNPNLEQNDGYN